jgi:hypothetical protein
MGDFEFKRKIRKAIRDSAPIEVTSTEVGDIFEAVMEVIRSENAAKEVRESELQQSRGPQVSDPWPEGMWS